MPTFVRGMNPPPLPPCPRCGQPRLPEELAGNCPACLGRELLFPVEPGPDAEEPPAVGRLGEFELLAEIARGGMGVVYRARQQRLGRLVALKVLPPETQRDEIARARFASEAAAAARLRHPGLVPVHEFGEVDGRLFLALELIEGPNLADHVRRGGPLPPRVAAELVAQVADALQHAHQQGVLHRDLKPSNVLLDPSGVARVTDFGLARIFDGTPGRQVTLTGEAPGTPPYMAPEQAAGRGRNRPVGPPADIHALGGLLFFLLTGRQPFVGDHPAEILEQVRHVDPPSPHLLNPAVPANLATVCLKCLAKEPGRRYPSARAAGEDLRRFLRGEVVLARPVDPFTRSWLWARRHPAPATALALALLALVAGGVATASFRTSRLLAAQSRLANYVADMNLARQAVAEDNLLRARTLLDRHRPESSETELRGFEWWLLADQARGRQADVIFQSSNAVTALAVAGPATSAGGAPAFAAAGAGWVRQWHADRSPAGSWALPESEEPRALALSADGAWLAVSWTNRVALFTTNGQRRRGWEDVGGNRLAFDPSGRHLAVNDCPPSTSEPPTDVVVLDTLGSGTSRLAGRGGPGIGWRPDGRTLQLVRRYGSVDRWSPGETNVQRLLEGNDACYSACFSTSGRWVARAFFDGRVALHPLASGEAAAVGFSVVGQASRGVRLALSEEDHWLAIAGGADARVGVWRVTDGQRVVGLPGHLGEVTGIEFVPGRPALLSASRDGTVRRWTFLEPVREDFERLPHQLDSFNTRAPVYSPAGRWLAAPRAWADLREDPERSDEFVLWDRIAHARVTNLPARPVAFSPDSRRLLTWRQDGEMRGWDLATLRPGAPFRMANPAPHWNEELLSADATRLVGHDTNLNLHAYDAATGARQRTAARRCWTWTLSPVVELAAYVTPGPGPDVVVWDFGTGRERTVLHLREEAPELRFSPDGRWLAVGALDHLIHLVDLRGGPSRQLIGHQAGIMALEFTADGRTLISGGDDRTLVFWNLAAGREMFSLSQPGPVYWLRVPPDGQVLLTGHIGTVDGQVPSEYRLWPGPGASPSRPVAPTAPRPGTVWARAELR